MCYVIYLHVSLITLVVKESQLFEKLHTNSHASLQGDFIPYDKEVCEQADFACIELTNLKNISSIWKSFR